VIQDYLEDKSIEYWEGGSKNVSQGWLGIRCLFCDDHSNHLGINLSTSHIKCWLCNYSGNVIDLIQEIENCSFKKAKRIYFKIWEGDSQQKKDLPPSKVSIPEKRPSRVALPPILNYWPDKYLNFIKKRGYDPREVIEKYKLMPSAFVGEYRYRIIIPYYVNSELVTFTTRDVTGRAEIPYKDAKKEDSIIEPKHCIYNIDNMKGKKGVVVEGVFDVWRIGKNTGAISGKQLSGSQTLMLVKKEFEILLVLLDSDAIEKSKKYAHTLSGLIGEVIYGELDKGDPDEMSYNDLMVVKRFLG
jgi:DNA primase